MATLIGSVVLSTAGTWFMRRYALAHAIVDVPNRRSSHGVPTPRGGGAGLVAGLLITFVLALALNGSPGMSAFLPLLGILIVAAIGWRDDRASAGIALRLACHALGALTLLPIVWPADATVTWPASIAAIGWVVWTVASINVVNFMDGIDGLIGTFGAIFGAHLVLLGRPDHEAALFGAALAGASLGFLLFNWPPAKIFLGDVGSGALGMSAAFGGSIVARQSDVPLAAIFLPLYPLFLDATVTLVRRALRGERVTQPHRSHLYQRLANGGWGHARVTLLYAASGAGGLAVALAHATAGWTSLALGYAAIVLAIGWRLDNATAAAPVWRGAIH